MEENYCRHISKPTKFNVTKPIVSINHSKFKEFIRRIVEEEKKPNILYILLCNATTTYKQWTGKHYDKSTVSYSDLKIVLIIY